MIPQSPDAPLTLHDETIVELASDPVLAHQALFRHRHPDATPRLHEEIIQAWHSPARFALTMAFRGGGKSTLSEEALCVAACLRDFKNCLILGESETRAVDRLRSVKHEFETNELIQDLFGDLVGPTWAETKIVLANGVCIQAYGTGQSLRGVKHLDQRPDLILADDIENEETVATPGARDKMLKWWTAVVVPAMDPRGRIRFNATPLDEEALAVTLSNQPEVIFKKYPIKYRDEKTGQWVATWPERFPLTWCDAMEADLTSLGKVDVWAREYMCEPVSEKNRTFTAAMLPAATVRARSWHAVYAFYDPARTVKATSAHTGYAVWSWIGRRLVVWESGGRLWKPDEIIEDLFRVETQYAPVAIGVEEDGLNEFLLQPIRHAQVARAQPLPIRAMKAPKGKHEFIRGLQPFFKAGEVELVGDHAELRAQLLSFPTGKIDAPNALAYALRMRPGAPLYDGFTQDNIADLAPVPRETWRLVVNARDGATSAILFQLHQGRLLIFADWLQEGDPGSVLPAMVADASLAAHGRLETFAPPSHFSTYDTLGLRAAAVKIPLEVRRAGAEHVGREEVRSLLRKLVRGTPALLVSSQASWTLRALSGGYCLEVDKNGRLGQYAQPGPYRCLVEGLESVAALLRQGAPLDDAQDRHYQYTPEGRRYLSSLVR